MFFKQPDLTSGSRPTLSPDETLLYVQDNVGVYEGKYKIATSQKGHVYLTSHRACYIDDAEPRTNSLCFDLKDVDRGELQARFLRSSPKIVFHPKPLRRGFGSQHQVVHARPQQLQRLVASSSSPSSRSASPFRPSPVQASPPRVNTGTWICPICSFSNPIPSNFDASIVTEAFPLPPCLTCGIKPPFATVLKAAVQAGVADTSSQTSTLVAVTAPTAHSNGDLATSKDTITCPRCTFSNHKSLQNCEICDQPLPQITASATDPPRSVSPGPVLDHLNLDGGDEGLIVKFSFRAGGEKIFHERLKNALIQRKWILESAPTIPSPIPHSVSRSSTSTPQTSDGSPSRPASTAVGIAGLEQRGYQSRQTNENVLGSAFEDLEALMASAKEVVALAERFAQDSGNGSGNSVLSESATALGMVATRDVMGGGSSDLYVSEMSRNLAEYVTDERRGILKRQGGIMGLVDVWASFNRTRNGVELISPSDFYKAAEMWERLGLPVRLRRFKSGLLVVQSREWSDERIMQQLKTWLRPADESIETHFGRGVTAQDVAQRFGWSLGVATEELEMAEDRGALCRDESIEGVKFWVNYLTEPVEV